MFAIVRFYGIGQSIGGDINANSGFDASEGRNVARVSGRVGADAEGASGTVFRPMLQLRVIGEQLVLVHQLEPAGEEVPAAGGVERLREIGIEIALREEIVVPA